MYILPSFPISSLRCGVQWIESHLPDCILGHCGIEGSPCFILFLVLVLLYFALYIGHERWNAENFWLWLDVFERFYHPSPNPVAECKMYEMKSPTKVQFEKEEFLIILSFLKYWRYKVEIESCHSVSCYLASVYNLKIHTWLNRF